MELRGKLSARDVSIKRASSKKDTSDFKSGLTMSSPDYPVLISNHSIFDELLGLTLSL